jgi:dihydrofolate synthase/folylpolyglutamate synthase
MDGEFQKNNFLLAVTVLELLGFDSLKATTAAANTVIPARMHKLNIRGKNVIFDVAHNPQAMESLIRSLKSEINGESVSAVFGMMRDKDIKETIKLVNSFAENIFCFTAATKRAKLADYLAEDFREIGAKNVFVCKSAKEAFEKAIDASETVLVSGSFYVVSEVMKVANVEI